jgi:hypothetical protein
MASNCLEFAATEQHMMLAATRHHHLRHMHKQREGGSNWSAPVQPA